MRGGGGEREGGRESGNVPSPERYYPGEGCKGFGPRMCAATADIKSFIGIHHVDLNADSRRELSLSFSLLLAANII